MDLDWVLTVYGAVLSTVLAMWGIFVYWKDSYKLSVSARCLPSASLYIIEVRNSGARPVTIAAVGINEVFFGSNSGVGQTQLAIEPLPHRLEAYDRTYFSIYWDGGPEENKGVTIYVRDARNKTYLLPLHNVRLLALDAIGIAKGQDLSRAQLVQLYDAAVWQDKNIESKVRVRILDYEVEAMVAGELARRKGQQERKARNK
jgi:hypothetical protein